MPILERYDLTSNLLSESAHANTTAPSRLRVPRLNFFVEVPDVSRHGVGTSLQVPGGQGQLGVELVLVGGLGDGRQSVGAPPKQEVTEGNLDGGHVWREEVVLNLKFKKQRFQ